MKKILIRDIETLQALIPEIAYEKDFLTCEPLLQRNTETILMHLLGPTLHQELVDYSEDSNNESGSPSGSPSGSSSGSYGENPAVYKKKTLYFAMDALANSLAFELAKTGDVNFTSMGLQTMETNELKGISVYQKRDIMNAYSQRMDESIDKMLHYLELWDPSSWPEALKTRRKESFLPDAAAFSAICNIFESRRTFLALHGFIQDNEWMRIIPITGKTLMLELKKTRSGKGAAGKSEKRTAAEKELIYTTIPAALAHFSMADAMRMLSLRLFSDGVTFASWLGVGTKQRDMEITDKDARRTSHMERGTMYLNSIRELLEENAEDFPEYTPLSTGSSEYQNDPESNHFLSFM